MRLGNSYFLATVLAVGVAASTLAQDKAVHIVGGFALGGKVKFDSEPYRKYECSPSEQFEGFIWCQSSRDERERRGAFKAYYGMLHSLMEQSCTQIDFKNPLFGTTMKSTRTLIGIRVN